MIRGRILQFLFLGFAIFLISKTILSPNRIKFPKLFVWLNEERLERIIEENNYEIDLFLGYNLKIDSIYYWENNTAISFTRKNRAIDDGTDIVRLSKGDFEPSHLECVELKHLFRRWYFQTYNSSSYDCF